MSAEKTPVPDTSDTTDESDQETEEQRQARYDQLWNMGNNLFWQFMGLEMSIKHLDECEAAGKPVPIGLYFDIHQLIEDIDRKFKHHEAMSYTTPNWPKPTRRRRSHSI